MKESSKAGPLMFSKGLIDKFRSFETPFYYYDMGLLERTLDEAMAQASEYDMRIHYAVKANANERVLGMVRDKGMGADCVSGNEVRRSLDVGFAPESVVFAGVGKRDEEIRNALKHGIFCFNVESIQELEVLDSIAAEEGKMAPVAIRINPNVDANTHQYITTGLEENKFGIDLWSLDQVFDILRRLENIQCKGIHFHIGSQITDLGPFKTLCAKVNEVQRRFLEKGLDVEHLNVGGGLGVDYKHPDASAIPDFQDYFRVFHELVERRPGQELHFELGRALVAQAGSLITKVLYVKEGVNTDFAIVDAGMTELIRPALYRSYHVVQNLTAPSDSDTGTYDVVGPICETSDRFGQHLELPRTRRGDLLAVRSTGAYGQVMASSYNLREPAKEIYSDELGVMDSSLQ